MDLDPDEPQCPQKHLSCTSCTPSWSSTAHPRPRILDFLHNALPKNNRNDFIGGEGEEVWGPLHIGAQDEARDLWHPWWMGWIKASRSGKFQVSRTGEGKKVDNNIKNTLLLDAVGPKLFWVVQGPQSTCEITTRVFSLMWASKSDELHNARFHRSPGPHLSVVWMFLRDKRAVKYDGSGSKFRLLGDSSPMLSYVVLSASMNCCRNSA